LNLFFLIISINNNVGVTSKPVCQTQCIEFLNCVNNSQNLGYTRGIYNHRLCYVVVPSNQCILCMDAKYT